MSSHSSNPPRGLSASNNRVVNAESFSEGQRRAVDRYVELSKSSGVLVGALVGSASWDLRPLVLEEGKIAILRFTDPALALQRARYDWFKEQLRRRLAWGPRPYALAFGEEAGQLWLKRSYFQRVLVDPGATGTEGSERYMLLQALVGQLRSFHQSGILHGHVAPANLVFEERTFSLFDGAFRSVASDPEPSQYSAPELGSEFPPTPACDVYGLGVVISQLLKGESPVGLRALAERAVDRDPRKRPALAEIEDQLTRLAAGTFVKNASQAASAAAAAARAGKKISATVTAPTEAPPAPTARKGYSPPERIARELKQTVILPRDLVDEARKEMLGGAPAKAAEPNTPVSPPPEEPPVSGSTTLATAIESQKESNGQKEEPRKENPEQRKDEPKILRKPSKPPPVLIAAIVIILAIVVLRVTGAHRMFGGKEYDFPFEEYWKSGQRSLMAQVAEAAIAGGVPAAKITIVGDAIKGGGSSLARQSLLRFVFNPRWEQQLSEGDRDAALKLALAQLYPEGVSTLPPFEKLHPVIIIAAMSDLALDKDLGAISKLPIKILFSAPPPLGPAFQALAESGVRTLGDPSVRALAHLAAGDSSDGVFDTFFSTGGPHDRLEVLMPIIGSNPSADAALLGYLERGQTLLADYAAWFHGDDVAQWDQASTVAKINLLFGEVPPSGLTLEQYADLLQFPDDAVKKGAVGVLSKSFLGKDSRPTLEFLASRGNLLGRFQAVALVSSFKLDPDSFYAFLTKWFESKPDPSTILGLLLVRSTSTGVDALNYQAASYLKRANWNADLQSLTALSRHPEGLARVLAYSKLDPSKPNERAVMQEALKKEPNKNFRDELARRLTGN